MSFRPWAAQHPHCRSSIGLSDPGLCGRALQGKILSSWLLQWTHTVLLLLTPVFWWFSTQVGVNLNLRLGIPFGVYNISVSLSVDCWVGSLISILFLVVRVGELPRTIAPSILVLNSSSTYQNCFFGPYGSVSAIWSQRLFNRRCYVFGLKPFLPFF